MTNNRKRTKDEAFHRGNQSRLQDRLHKKEDPAHSERENHSAHWWETSAFLTLFLAFDSSDKDGAENVNYTNGPDDGLEDELSDDLWF